LDVPPLRERGDDVLLLAEHIVERLAGELGVPIPELTPAARRKLSGYSYPGNVRELENILERALALAGDAGIGEEEIQLQESPSVDSTGNEALGDQLESVERDAIQAALEACRYNKTQAAKQLGLTLRALRYRMDKLGLS
nr:helix-turn-helix domain-containing protein [Gammaproteobacteria bacterium]